MSLLDTVEPDWYGNANSLSEKHTALVAKWKGHGTLGLYSRETVESLLEAQRAEYEERMAELRKEALLEAADDMERNRERWLGVTPENELRRMAEPDKTTKEGEK